MRIDIWSDVICPFCYIGRINLDEALAQAKLHPEITHRAFRLFPGEAPFPVEEMFARRYRQTPEQARETIRQTETLAAQAGLTLRLAGTKVGDTLDAHKLLIYAGSRQTQLLYRIYKAYFTEGRDIYDRAVLTELADGLLDRQLVESAFDLPPMAARIEADRHLANTYYIRGAPVFVFDGKTAISGAQPPSAFLKALRAMPDTPPQA